MKVELDNVTVFAGTSIKPGVWRHKVNVTQSFLVCVIAKWEGRTEKIVSDDQEWEITVKKIK
jgi:hypothetical protein